jgi:hypothetical protein
MASELDLVAWLAARHRRRFAEQAEDRLHEVVAESRVELAPHASIRLVDLLQLGVAEDDVVELQGVPHVRTPGRFVGP